MLVEERGCEFRMERKREIVFPAQRLFAGDGFAVALREHVYAFAKFCEPRSADEDRMHVAEAGLYIRLK